MFKYLYIVYHIESQQEKKEFDMITLSPVLEDYLEVVLRFQRKKHFARVSDISTASGGGKIRRHGRIKKPFQKRIIELPAL